MIYLIYCKNFCKCHNVPLPSTIKKKKREGKNKKMRHKKEIPRLWEIGTKCERPCGL
jgi:hypothetical protein